MKDDISRARDLVTPQPQRWRDAPENQALVKQAIGTGLLDDDTAKSVLDFHEKIASDPAPVFRSYIRSATHRGQPAPDMSKVKRDPLDAHEADIVDRILGGEIRTEKLV
ncbi:MAG: hypothetical protein ABI231_09070 [Candidatus Tumulicola sp.]